LSETITVKNLNQVLAGLTAYEGKLMVAAVYGLSQVAFAVEREAKNGWSPRHAPGTPTTATRGGKPASITGNLRRSIHTEIKQGFGTYVAEVGPTMIYSRRVELEYDYPYMRPAYVAMKPRANNIFSAAVKRKLRG
jgi:hypothetical protein